MEFTLLLAFIFLGIAVLWFVALAIFWICFEIDCNRMAKKHKCIKAALELVYMNQMIRITKQEELLPPNGEKDFDWYKFYLKGYQEIKAKDCTDVKFVFRQADEYEEMCQYVNENLEVWEGIDECYKVGFSSEFAVSIL